jgi:hypothetical protein
MAQGSAYVKAPTSTANNAFLDLRPGSGVEIVIHNVYWNTGAVELYWYDGTNSILLLADDGSSGHCLTGNWHCTNAIGLRVKNVAGSTQFLGADGMETTPS